MKIEPKFRPLFFSGIVVVAAMGYIAWKGHQGATAANRIHELEIEDARLNEKLSQYLGQILDKNEVIRDKEVEVADLRKKIAALPKPKPTVPLPPDTPSQVRFFEGFHLKPVVVPGGVGQLAFPPQDLPILGRALQDSENLPTVQRELADTKLLVEKLDGLGALKDDRIATGDKALETSQERTRNAQAEIDQYRKSLTAERRKSRVTKFLWGAAGIGIGVLIRK